MTKTLLIYHITAFVCGCFLDLLIGDPAWIFHPVRLIGALIGWLDRKLYPKEPKKCFSRGLLLVVTVLFITCGAVLVLTWLTYRLHPVLGIAAEAILTCYLLAARSLRDESMKVYEKLSEGDLPAARKALSMIVGRDTQELDEEGVVRAAVETVAENSSDGVVAPMLFTVVGGPVLGYFYKSVNTMDSMLGYKNDRYLYFGRAAAILDDICNFLPARLSALCMLAAAAAGGRQYSAKDALKVFYRDRRKSASPNAGQTEAVLAGAMGLKLLGPASYFGKLCDKPYIGDEKRKAENEDIRRADQLMFMTAFTAAVICLVFLFLLLMMV